MCLHLTQTVTDDYVFLTDERAWGKKGKDMPQVTLQVGVRLGGRQLALAGQRFSASCDYLLDGKKASGSKERGEERKELIELSRIKSLTGTMWGFKV